MMPKYDITENTLKIYDSCEISKGKFARCLGKIKAENPSCLVFWRSYDHLSLEWASHNFLYSLGLWRSHTKDVDFEFPQKWYWQVVWAILGVISWIFIK